MLQVKDARRMQREPTSPVKFPPGATIGMLGSGQLGRMFTHAAQRLGYRVHVFSTHESSPAGQAADLEIVGRFDDRKALAEFARRADVITLEFENVPVAAVETMANHVPVQPGPRVLQTVQHRLREKQFLADANIACTPFRAARCLEDVRTGLREIGYPAILKTAVDGYDGKGQARLNALADAEAAWDAMDGREAILEAFADFKCELSIIAARSADGSTATFGPLLNSHVDHILDVTVLPAGQFEQVGPQATSIAEQIVRRLDVVGIICVEFFLCRDGSLLVNEIAPRPHNSGHLTIEACATSQFEQHVRAVCGLPLGSTLQMRPAAMANLLGQLWENGEPDWQRALEIPDVHLHLYGKSQPRPGRKMGHLTALADTPAQAEKLVREARNALAR